MQYARLQVKALAGTLVQLNRIYEGLLDHRLLSCICVSPCSFSDLKSCAGTTSRDLHYNPEENMSLETRSNPAYLNPEIAGGAALAAGIRWQGEF